MTAVPSGAGPTRPHVDPVPVEARPIQGRRAGVVTRTAAGLAAYLKDAGAPAGASVVIGYDARHNSDVFARDTAEG